MKNKWPKRAPALLAAVALTASMFPTGALALEAERQDTAETVTAAVQQTPTPTIAVENVETGNTATPETAAEPETQLQEETVEQEESAIQTAETAALQQEPEAETAVQALAAEPDSLGKVWLTEIFPNDFDNRNKNEYGTTDDRFEYIELINTADTPVNLTTDYELVYGTKADNAKPFAVQETDGSDVVLKPGEVTVVWNKRTNVKKPGTVEDFRSNYMIPDNVHIVISQYGEDWANTGYFGLRARATGTVCADYSYVNGTIDKNDGKDIADGLGVDLAIPNVGYSMTASTKKTAATPGYVYSEQRGGNTTAPAGTEGLYVTEIYPNDGDRSAVYGVSDDLMEFVEVTNTTDHDIDFNANYQFQYIYKTQFTRLTVCTVEDAHKEALGEVTRAELDAKSAVIPAHSSAVFWCYRESWLTGLTQPFPDEAAFRAAYNMPEGAPLYCVLGQNGMKNTDRAVGISHAENGRQVLVSSFFYNGLTDTKDKKSVNLSPSAEGPRMTACTLQQAPTPGSVSDAQFNFPADDGSTVKLGMWQDSTVPATITQGDELRVRFSYSVDEGALPRTKITTYYRFDGTGNWNNKTETYRRVPGLYEMNIAANELFDHEYVEFYVAADNRYHRTTTQVYRVNIQKLSSLIDGIRTNITDGQQVRSTVTATANDGGDNANSKILLDGVELPVGKVLENGAYYSFATAGRDSYFHNALTLADDNLTDDSKMEHIASLLKWQNYRLDGFAVPIDSHYFTYDAASDSLVLSWNGRASNADATHASRLFVQNTATGAWDEAATADENGSMAVRVPVKDHVQDGTATVMVQCTADSALPDFSGVTDQAPAAAWDGTTIPRNYDFAFAWETDTQYYSEEFFQHYLNMNNWIVDNKDKLNIRYVIHTGDIVDDFDMPYEWENADEAMKILDDANMPYGVLAGNHDIAAGAMEYENYQKYFGAQRVQDQPTFGEAYKDNIGHYDLLTENGQDFIILYMSWDIYADEINWMNSVLQKYSDRKAILCFHTYTRVAYNSDGGLMDYYGQLVQDNVVAQNPNVIAVLNGHYHGASYETTVFDDDKDGVYDRTVYQICTDYQSGFEGGSGYIKMLYFDLDNNKIYINSYSPSLDDFNYYDNTSVTELGTESAASVAPDTAADGSALPKRINNNINTDILTLDVNFHTDPQTILTSYFGAYLDRGEEIGTADFTVAQDSSRTGTAALTWDGLQPGTAYAWYAQVTNTLGSIQQTAVQRFTTAAVPADVPPTPGNAPAEPDPGPNTGNATSTGNTGSTSTAAVSQGAAQTAGKGSTPAAATAAIPQTGDTMPIVAVVLLCLGSMTALGILTIYRRKRKED